MGRFAIKLSSLFILFLFFLPFAQALTLNISFPLKISELILGVLIFIFIAKLIPFKKFKPLTKVSLVILMFPGVVVSSNPSAYPGASYISKAV